MTESVNDDAHHGDDKGRQGEKDEAGLVPCQADQLGGSADSSCKPV